MIQLFEQKTCDISGVDLKLLLPTHQKKSMSTNVPLRGPHHIRIKTCPITVRGVGTEELGGGSTKGVLANKTKH
jgi:hypothetical protein